MSDRNYRVNRFRGGWAVVWNEPDGSRPRHKLESTSRQEAEREKDRLVAEWEKPQRITVRWLWDQYRAQNAHKRIAANMQWSGKPILDHWGDADPEDISVKTCRTYVERRRNQGRQDGTIWTELNHLQVVLNWARRQRLITAEIAVERPTKPPPRDRRLTKREAGRLMKAAVFEHVRLAIAIMLNTGARSGAILDLTWDRVDFTRGTIAFGRHEPGVRRKGRATVPINDDLLPLLQKGRQAAVTDHVIEWAGRPVKSLKKGFATAVTNAGLTDVTPHVLRHSAATWMAEAGVPMSEIAAMLGHSDSRTTERIYARFTPTHLRRAASALSGVLSGPDEPGKRKAG